MVELQEPGTRDIPRWLTGLVLALCVGGGGWLVYGYLREPGGRTVAVPPDDPAVTGAGGRFRGPLADYRPGPLARVVRKGSLAGPVDGVQTSGPRGNAWIVRAGEATMHVAMGGNGQLDLSPAYVTQHLTADQAQALLMRRRLLTDPGARARLKLTDAQHEELKGIEEFKGMIVEPADRAKLAALFEAWRKGTDPPAAERALVAALAEVGKRSVERTKAFDAGRAERVRKILTPEQVQLYNG